MYDWIVLHNQGILATFMLCFGLWVAYLLYKGPKGPTTKGG